MQWRSIVTDLRIKRLLSSGIHSFTSTTAETEKLKKPEEQKILLGVRRTGPENTNYSNAIRTFVTSNTELYTTYFCFNFLLCTEPCRHC
jgi:hypothetical protein